MRKSSAISIAAAVAMCGAAATAHACPLCDSDRAEEVRAGLFDDQFARNLAASVLPFTLLAGLVAAVHFGGPKPAQPRGQTPSSPGPRP